MQPYPVIISNCVMNDLHLFHTALRAAIRSRGAAPTAKTAQPCIDATSEICSQSSRTGMGKMEGPSFQNQLEKSLKRRHASWPNLTGERAIASQERARRFHIQGLPMLLSAASKISAGEMTLSDEETTISWHADKKDAEFDDCSFSSSIFDI
jgi:hypothetical protein